MSADLQRFATINAGKLRRNSEFIWSSRIVMGNMQKSLLLLQRLALNNAIFTIMEKHPNGYEEENSFPGKKRDRA